MYRRSFVSTFYDRNMILHTTVLLNWIAGLSLGIYADRFYGEAYRACFMLTAHQIPDFFGVMCICVLPLLISAYAVSFFPFLLFGICLFYGILTGLGISAAAILWGSGCGITVILSLFRLLLYGPVLLWYWLGGRGTQFLLRDTVICMILGIIISWLDCAVVAPFLWEITNF